LDLNNSYYSLCFVLLFHLKLGYHLEEKIIPLITISFSGDDDDDVVVDINTLNDELIK